MGGGKFVSESNSDSLRIWTLIAPDELEGSKAVDGTASTSEYKAKKKLSASLQRSQEIPGCKLTRNDPSCRQEARRKFWNKGKLLKG